MAKIVFHNLDGTTETLPKKNDNTRENKQYNTGDARLDKVFLLQALNQMTQHFREIAPAGTQPNLNTAIMKSYMQIIPPMEMQKEFIGFVNQVDKSKVVVQKALDEAQTLFDFLMQEYFG